MSNNNGERKIKKAYGEKMMHLCRELFPSIPSSELATVLQSNFEAYDFLYDDLVKYGLVNSFRNYIHSFFPNESNDIVRVEKRAKELFEEKGYELFECKTYEEVLKFRGYYGNDGEELCSFRENKLDRYHIFFAVKRNVDEIKREDFNKPYWQDTYGTSVLLIKVSKGNINFMSITGRYNTYGERNDENADNLFNSNLDNINMGLMESFRRDYNFNFKVVENDFKIPGYVKSKDGKYYKYNYEINDIYYCVDNVIIDKNKEVIKTYLAQEKYIVLDYFILDLGKYTKSISLFDEHLKDSFIDGIKDIRKIDIKKNNNNRTITIYSNNNIIIIVIDKYNRIIEYYNNSIEIINDDFLLYNETLRIIDISNAITIGNNFLPNNLDLYEIYAKKARYIGNNCLKRNTSLKKVILDSALIIGDYFMLLNKGLEIFIAPFLEKIGIWFLYSNNNLKTINIPNIKYIGNKYLMSNPKRKLELSSKMMQEKITENFNFSIKEVSSLTHTLTTKVKDSIKKKKLTIAEYKHKKKEQGGSKRR